MSIVSIDYTRQHIGQSGLEKKNKKFDFCGNCIRKYLKEGNV